MNATILTSTHLKGGSGATLVSMNLAFIAAASFPNEVLFLQCAPVSDMGSFFPGEKIASSQDFQVFLEETDMDIDQFRSLCMEESGLSLFSFGDFHDFQLQEHHIHHVITLCQKHFRYIFIDCPAFFQESDTFFQFSDSIFFFSYLDLQSIHLLRTFEKHAFLKGFVSKVFLILNQLPPTLSKAKAEKILQAKIFSTIPSDPEAIIELNTFGKFCIHNRRLPLTHALHKLWNNILKLSS